MNKVREQKIIIQLVQNLHYNIFGCYSTLPNDLILRDLYDKLVLLRKAQRSVSIEERMSTSKEEMLLRAAEHELLWRLYCIFEPDASCHATTHLNAVADMYIVYKIQSDMRYIYRKHSDPKHHEYLKSVESAVCRYRAIKAEITQSTRKRMTISPKMNNWLDKLVSYRRNGQGIQEAIDLCVEFMDNDLGTFKDAARKVAAPKHRKTLYRQINSFLEDTMLTPVQKEWFKSTRKEHGSLSQEKILRLALKGEDLGLAREDIAATLKKRIDWCAVDQLRNLDTKTMDNTLSTTPVKFDMGWPSERAYTRSQLCDVLNMPNTTLRRWLGIIEVSPPAGFEQFHQNVEVRDIYDRPVKHTFTDKVTGAKLSAEQVGEIINNCVAEAEKQKMMDTIPKKETLADLKARLMDTKQKMLDKVESFGDNYGVGIADLHKAMGIKTPLETEPTYTAGQTLTNPNRWPEPIVQGDRITSDRTNIQDCKSEDDAYIEDASETDLEVSVEGDFPVVIVLNGASININDPEYFKIAMESLLVR